MATVTVRNGTLSINNVPVAVVFDSKSCPWFRGNDLAKALGYSNASGALSRYVPAANKMPCKMIDVRQEVTAGPIDPRNVFIDMTGLSVFMSAVKLPSLSDFLNELCRCVESFKRQTPKSPADRATNGQEDLLVNFSSNSLAINGTEIACVVDVDECMWFKGCDVVEALHFKNTSYFLSKYVSDADKVPFKTISVSKSSKAFQADPRHIFISQSGLFAALSVFDFSSTSKNKLHDFVSAFNSHCKAKTAPPSKGSSNKRIPNIGQARFIFPFEPGKDPQNDFKVPLFNEANTFSIDGIQIMAVLNSNNIAWFKCSDVAAAFGCNNNIIARHVADTDRAQFKNLTLNRLSPKIDARPSDIFMSESGLNSLISAGKLAYPIDKCMLIEKIDQFKLQIIACNHNEAKSPSNDDSGFILIEATEDNLAHQRNIFIVKTRTSLSREQHIVWKQTSSKASTLMKLIKFLLGKWDLCEKKSFGMYSVLHQSELCRVVNTIFLKYEKTVDFVSKFCSKINKQPSVVPGFLSTEDVNKRAKASDSSGRMEWIYIASCEKYASRNVYKVGSTDRLARRLGGYQTGRLAEDFYHYYWVRRVYDSGNIDHMILKILNYWSQKSGTKSTEMYELEFDSLRCLVESIIDMYEELLLFVGNVMSLK